MSDRLQGLGVVITRPREPAEVLAAALEREGALTFVFPTLEIEDVAPSAGADAALAALPGAALAIFVSAHAVQKGLPAVRARGPWPADVPVAAVGEATAEALRNSGFARVISPPERHDSDGLLALAPLQRVQGKQVVIFRGQGGRERLKEVLEQRGARVSYLESYRRVRPHADPGALVAAWSRGEVQAVNALSGETLENFVAMVGEAGGRYLAATTLVVPHEAIAAHRDARRFGRVLVTGHGAEALTETLSQLRVPT